MMSKLLFLGMTATLTFGAGCAPDYPACKKDKHCKAELGETCVEGTCQNCKVDADCVGKAPAGAVWVCHEFRCQDPNAIGQGSGNGEMGAPCQQKLDCFGGLVCNAGKCSTCTDDIQCAPSTCNMDTQRCGASGQCTTDDQCPMDEICDGGMCIYSGTAGAGEICGLEAVYFAFDSDSLTPKSEEDLTAAAQCIMDGGQSVILEAHADNVGTEEYNIHLTQRRGDGVKNFLIEKGVAAEKLSVLSKGSLEATGSTESERAKDRRVQLVPE